MQLTEGKTSYLFEYDTEHNQFYELMDFENTDMFVHTGKYVPVGHVASTVRMLPNRDERVVETVIMNHKNSFAFKRIERFRDFKFKPSATEEIFATEAIAHFSSPVRLYSRYDLFNLRKLKDHVDHGKPIDVNSLLCVYAGDTAFNMFSHDVATISAVEAVFARLKVEAEQNGQLQMESNLARETIRRMFFVVIRPINT